MSKMSWGTVALAVVIGFVLMWNYQEAQYQAKLKAARMRASSASARSSTGKV